MRCRRARLAIVERPLGLLAPTAMAALERHLGGCPACAAEARIEREIRHHLEALRESYPFEIDLGRRVAAGIAAEGAIDRREVPVRQIAWGAVAAACAAVIPIAAGLRLVPELPGLLRTVRTLAGAALSVAFNLVGALADVLAVPLRLFGPLAESVGPLAGMFVPSPGAVAVSCWVLMLGAAVLVLSRDTRRAAAVLDGQEPRT